MPTITILYFKSNSFCFWKIIHWIVIFSILSSAWFPTFYSVYTTSRLPMHQALKQTLSRTTCFIQLQLDEDHECFLSRVSLWNFSLPCFSIRISDLSLIERFYKNLIVCMGLYVWEKEYFPFSSKISFKRILYSFIIHAPKRDGKSSSIYILVHGGLTIQPVGLSTHTCSLSLSLSLSLSVSITFCSSRCLCLFSFSFSPIHTHRHMNILSLSLSFCPLYFYFIEIHSLTNKPDRFNLKFSQTAEEK